MTHSRHKFNMIAKSETEKTKCLPPFSLRLTYEERTRLDAERGDKSLAAYTRERLFGDDVAPRKRRGNSPVQDKEALPLMAARLVMVMSGSASTRAFSQSETASSLLRRGRP